MVIHAGFVQAWISRRDRFQHEAVCRGIHAEACQAVQEVCWPVLNVEPGYRLREMCRTT